MVRRTQAPRDPRLKDVSQAVLACRGNGHRYEDGVDEIRQRWRWPEVDVVKQINRCTRCKSVIRIRHTDEFTGEYVVPNKLVYRKGYLAPAGTGRIERAKVRMEETHRFLETHPLPQKRSSGPSEDTYEDYFTDDQ